MGGMGIGAGGLRGGQLRLDGVAAFCGKVSGRLLLALRCVQGDVGGGAKVGAYIRDILQLAGVDHGRVSFEVDVVFVGGVVDLAPDLKIGGSRSRRRRWWG